MAGGRELCGANQDLSVVFEAHRRVDDSKRAVGTPKERGEQELKPSSETRRESEDDDDDTGVCSNDELSPNMASSAVPAFASGLSFAGATAGAAEASFSSSSLCRSVSSSSLDLSALCHAEGRGMGALAPPLPSSKGSQQVGPTNSVNLWSSRRVSPLASRDFESIRSSSEIAAPSPKNFESRRSSQKICRSGSGGLVGGCEPLGAPFKVSLLPSNDRRLCASESSWMRASLGGEIEAEEDGNGKIAEDEATSEFPSSNLSTASELSKREEHAKEWAHQPRRIALFVEPSPFAYICGYKNRFQNFIRYLREMGDEVLIVTTHRGLPEEFYGAKVVGSWSFPCPWYENLFLSLALSPRIFREVANFKPDIVHACSPGVMVFGALIIAKLTGTPIVMSYHTHIPMYIPKYTFSWLVAPMWWIIRLLHRAADWTLVVSQVLGNELKNKGAAAADRIGLWSKGVDSETFHPRFKSHDMRVKLTKGKPESLLVVHVGRLGVEKNLDFMKSVMERLPEAHFAFVGDGPYRADLEKMFEGMNVTFTGMLSGEPLSQAYASGDVFITPSETETLGFVVLEAMASGVPVVAARAGGIIDIVNKEGKTGFLYTPGDLDDCVEKLKALFVSPALRANVGLAGREEVENFDWRTSTRKVRNEMYTSAIWFWRRQREQLA